jgi:hypothetical protein
LGHSSVKPCFVRFTGLWHNSWINGYRANNEWYPEQKAAILILDNLDTADPVPIANGLENMLFSKTGGSY